MTTTRMLGAIVAAGAATAAHAEFTNFDHLAEDIYGTEFTDNGITFSNAFSDGSQRSIAIDDGTELFENWDITDWVSGKVLGMGGYSNGPGNVLFPAFDRLDMSIDGVVDRAAFTFFHVVQDANNYRENTITIEALLNGDVVETLVDNPGNVIFDNGRTLFGAKRFEIEGVEFDTIRFTAEGPMNSGRVVGLFEDVEMVPAPGALALLGLGGLVAGRRRR